MSHLGRAGRIPMIPGGIAQRSGMNNSIIYDISPNGMAKMIVRPSIARNELAPTPIVRETPRNNRRWEDMASMELHELYFNDRDAYDKLRADWRVRNGVESAEAPPAVRTPSRPSSLVHNGKTWDQLDPMEKHELYHNDRARYERLKGAARC